MPTTVVKSIGATGRDYSLPQSWEDARPVDHTLSVTSTTGSGSTTSAITLNAGASGTAGAYVSNTLTIAGETRLITAYNETTKVATVGSLNGSAATFTSAPGSGVSYTIGDVIWKGECYNDAPFTTQCIISGGTTSATCYAWLTAAAGQSFIDNANVRTNALAFNQANGVAFERASVSYEEGTIQALAAYTKVDRLQVKTNGTGTYGKRNAVECGYSGNGTVIRDCILEVTYSGRDCAYICGNAIINCVVRSTSGNGVYLVDSGSVRNCTIVAGGSNCVYASYWYGTINGNAMFGSSGLATRLTHTGAELSTGSYNGTDKSAAPGTNNQTSLMFGNCFESTTDLRLKAGSSLIGVGNTDATNAPNDITGRVRDAGTAGDIGAWEWSDPTLYGQIDETTASDTDYITAASAGSVAELGLGTITDPGVDTLHSIKLRASGSGSLQVDLVQGGALLTIWTSKTRTQQPREAPAASWDFRPAALAIPSIGVDVVAGGTRQVSGGVTLAVGEGGAIVAKAPATQIPGFIAYNLGRPVVVSGDFSLMVLASATANPGSVQTHTFETAAGLSNCFFAIGSTSSGAYIDGNGPANITGDFTKPTTFIIVRRGNQMTFYAAGQSTTGTTGTRTGEITGLLYGRDRSSNNSDNGSRGYVLAAFDYGLSVAQVGELQAQPWRLIAPENRPRHIPAAKLIASRTIPLIATPTDYRRELLPAEAALITDYSDLRVRLTGV